MDLQEITNQIQTSIKKGELTNVHYQTSAKKDPTYRKETKTVIRFVHYGNIKGVEVKGKPNPNETHIIPDILIYNKNTQQYYLQMAIFPSETIKPQVTYYHLDQEIDKATFETIEPSKPRTQPLVIFRKNIKDIISLG